MKYLNSTIFALLLSTSVLGTSACGTLVGNGSDDGLASSIGAVAPSSNVYTFQASFGVEVLHSVGFSNNSSNFVTLSSLRFSNNLCNDFSVSNITSKSGSVLANSSDSLNINVGAGQEININIRYSPSSCLYTDYKALLYVFYNDGSKTKYIVVTLQPITTSGNGPFACDEIDDEKSSLYTETTFTGSIPNGSYFLRVDRMRAYIYAPKSGGAVQPEALALGTDINGLKPEDYIAPYLSVAVSGNSFELGTIENKMDFCLPSPDDNFFFQGASTLLTTSSSSTGTIDGDGHVTTNGLDVTILSEHIPEGSAVDLANSDRVFQISLNSDLSTTKAPATTPDSTTVTDGLLASQDQQDDSGNSLLPIEEGAGGDIYLVGAPLENGHMTLVGVGSFNNSQGTFLGADIAKTFLIESEAYIYMMMDVTIMQEAQ